MPAQALVGADRLTYATFGDPAAPPAILVHGWLSHRGVWRQTIPALQTRYFCVAVDLLGFGDSDKPAAGDYSIAAQAGRVVALADQLGLERFTLVGHSMGGQICSYAAARTAPERVVRLVSVAGVVTGRLQPMVERLVYPMVNLAAHYPSLYRLAPRLSRWSLVNRLVFNNWFYRMDVLPMDSWEIDRRMATRPEIAISARLAGEAIHAGNLTTHLPHVLAPTLGIYGRQDRTVPFSDGELLQRLVPGARLASLEACGHFPMYEQTGTYLEALTGFLYMRS